jgi:hypothetical protein
VNRLYGARHSASWLKRLVGGRNVGLPPAAPTADLRHWCTYVDDQVGDRCVGDAFEGARWIAVRGQGQRGSPRGIYVGARAREVERAQGVPIPDVGCDPQDAMDALVEVGVFPRDGRDDAFDQVTGLDTWSEAVAKKPFDPSAFVPVDFARLDVLDQWLTAGYAAAIWFQVDQSWSSLSPGNPTWYGLRGPVLGGHATVLAGYTGQGEDDYYLDWNSYGPMWGMGGFAQIPRRVLRLALQGSVVVTGGPIL